MLHACKGVKRKKRDEREGEEGNREDRERGGGVGENLSLTLREPQETSGLQRSLGKSCHSSKRSSECTRDTVPPMEPPRDRSSKKPNATNRGVTSRLMRTVANMYPAQPESDGEESAMKPKERASVSTHAHKVNMYYMENMNRDREHEENTHTHTHTR
jgi:hypothetical protein